MVKRASYTSQRKGTPIRTCCRLQKALSKNNFGAKLRLYINPIFGPKQRWILTVDLYIKGRAWSVHFDVGNCGFSDVGSSDVRAVRSGQMEPPQKQGDSEPIINMQIVLRKTPATLSEEQVKTMLKKYSFYCAEDDWTKAWSNPQGNGITHNYVGQTLHSDKVVLDKATGLMWQEPGSSESMTYAKAENYVRDLNNQSFAGFTNWRLPTLEEAMSLMEPQEKNGDLYIDPVFDKTQRYIWTADKKSGGVAWVVSFYDGYCYHHLVGIFDLISVRAVRVGQSVP